jgi:hypothetical protein
MLSVVGRIGDGLRKQGSLHNINLDLPKSRTANYFLKILIRKIILEFLAQHVMP